jgi:solute carrier family 25 protein 39/40
MERMKSLLTTSPSHQQHSNEHKSALMPRVVSGSIGSIITSLAVTPLEVVKIRIQANTMEYTAASVGTTSPNRLPYNVQPCPQGCGTFVLNNGQMDCILPKNAVPFFDHQSGKLTQQARTTVTGANNAHNMGGRLFSQLGTFGMVRRIFLEEGVHGIYAGLRPTLVMAVPNTVLYFSAYEEIVWRLRKEASDPSTVWIPLVAGGSARFLASSFTAPFELIRTRQASAIGRSQESVGLIHELRSIIQQEGFRGLYRGLAPTLWRDVPFSAVYWLCIEHFREMWKERAEEPPTTLQQTGEAFVNGAVAGMIAACFTTPMDVVKTRQQAIAATATESVPQHRCNHNGAEAYKTPKTNVPHRDAGTLTHMRYIAKTEGLAGLWRGNQSRMIKVAPSCAIMISSYELGKRLLE